MRISDWSSDVCSSDLLVQANVNTRVRDPPIAFFFSIRNDTGAKSDVTLQNFAVVRQFRQDFACGPRTHVAMMRESGGLHRNVVRTNLALQLWQTQVDGFSTHDRQSTRLNSSH